MTSTQFHSLAAPIWLIAANMQAVSWFAVACAAIFAYHGCAGAWYALRELQHG
jgi:hypothetical protein